MKQRAKLSLLVFLLGAAMIWMMLGTYTRRGSLQHPANPSDTVSALLAPSRGGTRP